MNLTIHFQYERLYKIIFFLICELYIEIVFFVFFYTMVRRPPHTLFEGALCYLIVSRSVDRVGSRVFVVLFAEARQFDEQFFFVVKEHAHSTHTKNGRIKWQWFVCMCVSRLKFQVYIFFTPKSFILMCCLYVQLENIYLWLVGRQIDREHAGRYIMKRSMC